MIPTLLVAIVSLVPPAMTKRAIAPPTIAPAHATITVPLAGKSGILILPTSWKPKNKERLWIHFHGPDWHTVAEHERAGHSEPVLHVSVGEGSSVYAALFKDPKTWPALLVSVTKILNERAHRKMLQIEGVHLSSFSAGYGAIRELVQQPSAFTMMRSVTLCDSMYGSLESLELRRPFEPHIAVWKPLAQEAIAGRKTVVATVSSVPTPKYASSSECLAALVDSLEIAWNPANPSWPASQDPDFPLIRFASSGSFFAAHYGGLGPDAHTTHTRHLADLWEAFGIR